MVYDISNMDIEDRSMATNVHLTPEMEHFARSWNTQ